MPLILRRGFFFGFFAENSLLGRDCRYCDWKGAVLRGVGTAPNPLIKKAIDESIIDPSKTPSKTPSKSPHKTAYRSTSLHSRSCAKSILTASLTRSVREVFLPVRTVRKSARRETADRRHDAQWQWRARYRSGSRRQFGDGDRLSQKKSRPSNRSTNGCSRPLMRSMWTSS
jgi:hypothetical protein